ncbi:MAG TPA: substrate-binding domain-containing protein [Xanthobacteraceae bacterium]|nr:substrate-binding domain-containing protein [Xanthobacteraceae bacterium]
MHSTLSKSLLAAAALLLSTALASAAEIRVIAVGALQTALKAIGPEYTKQSGNQVTFKFTNPANLKKDLSEGKYDVVIAATPSIDEIDKAGGLTAGSRVKAVKVGIGVAVKEGAPKPDVSTPDAFKKAVTAARNIVYTDPATPNGSGAVTMRILAAAGLTDVVKAKGKQEGLGPGKELIAKGEYEMGLFNISEATIPGVVVAGPVPPPLQEYTNYDAAVLAGPPGGAAAGDFLKFITGKGAAAAWKAANIDVL